MNEIARRKNKDKIERWNEVLKEMGDMGRIRFPGAIPYVPDIIRHLEDNPEDYRLDLEAEIFLVVMESKMAKDKKREWG